MPEKKFTFSRHVGDDIQVRPMGGGCTVSSRWAWHPAIGQS